MSSNERSSFLMRESSRYSVISREFTVDAIDRWVMGSSDFKKCPI